MNENNLPQRKRYKLLTFRHTTLFILIFLLAFILMEERFREYSVSHEELYEKLSFWIERAKEHLSGLDGGKAVKADMNRHHIDSSKSIKLILLVGEREVKPEKILIDYEKILARLDMVRRLLERKIYHAEPKE